MGKVYIGTSGWVYKDWQKHFYPADIPARAHFQYYTSQFPTVEINATFYRLPTLRMVKGWREKAPPGFVFAVKGSRFITHILKISRASKGLRKYFSRIKPMAKRTGPILWQLPPFMKKAPNVSRNSSKSFQRITATPSNFAIRHGTKVKKPLPCCANTKPRTLTSAHSACP